jgi:hydroxyacylglutathione hydrolase
LKGSVPESPQLVSDEIGVEEIPGARRVADGVWLLAGRPRNAYNVYVVGDALVDAGTRHAARRILRQVRGLALKSHVLTHGHLDHRGSSHEVCEKLGLPLLCGEADVAEVESGGRAGFDEKPLLVRAEHRLLAGPGHPVSETLAEGDRVGEFSVLEVPGHSPGHLAFWRQSDRVLILGDVVFNLRLPSGRKGLQLPPNLLTTDPERNLASARRLAELEPEIVCFGHGPPLRDGELFRRFVRDAKVERREQ